MSDDQENEWLLNAAEKVLNELEINEVSFQAITDDMGALDGDTSNLDAMKSDDFFVCAVCGKQYSKRGWLKKICKRNIIGNFTFPRDTLKTIIQNRLFFLCLCYIETRATRIEWVMEKESSEMCILNGYLQLGVSTQSTNSGFLELFATFIF